MNFPKTRPTRIAAMASTMKSIGKVGGLALAPGPTRPPPISRDFICRISFSISSCNYNHGNVLLSLAKLNYGNATEDS